MLRFLSGFLLVLAASILVFLKSPLPQYLKPKQDRLYQIWKKDFSKLSEDQKFSAIFNNLAKIEVHFTDPQVAEEFEKFQIPFTSKPGNSYTLKIGITRWIEKSEYGFVIQHELFDQTGDKVYELGRTYKVGIIL